MVNRTKDVDGAEEIALADANRATNLAGAMPDASGFTEFERLLAQMRREQAATSNERVGLSGTQMGIPTVAPLKKR